MSTLLGRPLVLGLGPRPIICLDNEFLGPILLQFPFEILLSGSLGRKKDFDVTAIALCSLHPTAACEDTFLTAQGTLLTLRSLECAFIKFLLLFVPYVLCCDVDRTAKNPVGMGAGIFPLVSFFL